MTTAAGVLPPLGIFARTFTGTTPLAVLTQARDAGFETVQYNMACSGLPSLPQHVAPAMIDALRAAARETGVQLAALSATYNMIHPDPAMRDAGHAALAALADVATAVGIPMLTLCTGSRNADDQWAPHPENGSADAWRDLRDSLARAIAVAEQHDLRLGIEPEPANVVASAAHARRLIDELQGARVGVVFDVANLLAPVLHERASVRRDLVAQSIDVVADRIILVHAKDRAADGSFVAPGAGVVDFVALFRALERAGVRAPVITHGFEAVDARDACVVLRSALLEAAG